MKSFSEIQNESLVNLSDAGKEAIAKIFGSLLKDVDNRTAPEDNTDTEIPSNEVINNPNLSINEIMSDYLFGIDLVDPNGNPFPKSMIASYINSAITYVENMFDITLTPTDIKSECHDYERNDYTNWGYMQLWKRPIREITGMRLMYGNRPSFEIPLDWLKIDKKGGKVQMFPSQGNVSTLIISGTGAIYGLHNFWSYAPQMWEVDYSAGMESNEMPANIKELIYKKACISILTVWGDLLGGAGIVSQSLSIDGLSQSTNLARSATNGLAYARCEAYRNDVSDLIPVIRQSYAGINMVVL